MREAAARQNGKSGQRARRFFPPWLLLLLASFALACTPEGGALRPSLGSGGSAGGGSSIGDGAAGLLPGGGGAGGGEPEPSRPRPLLLEPIAEDRPSGGDRALGEDDLRSLGELSILPHVVQSISSGAPCDFKDAMSNCQ